MKIAVDPRTLRKKLEAVQAVRPIQAVRIEARGNRLTLEAPGEHADVRLEVPAEVEIEGEAYLLPNVLASVVKALPESKAVMALDENRLRLEAGSFRTHLAVVEDVQSVVAWPEITPQATLEGQDLAHALAAVLPATARESHRGVFRGVRFELSGRTRLVATDGFRLALYDLEAPSGDPTTTFVVAAPAASILRRLALEDPEVEIGYDDKGQVFARGRAFALRLGTLAGSFPDYERVFPSTFSARATLEAGEFSAAIRRLLPLLDKEAQQIDLALGPEGLRLKTESDHGRGEDFVAATVEGEPLTLALNASYLLDAVQPIEAQVTLTFSGALTPLTVRGEGGYLGVLVPLRVPHVEQKAA